MRAAQLLVAGAAGLILALGFGLAGIIRPEVIVGFLDFTGAWSPGVMLVMGAAVSLTMLAYRLTFRRERPLLGGRFMVPTRRDIDTRLVLGSALFGAGWGLTGYCPGPALASITTGQAGIYIFLGAMVAGMLLFTAWDRATARAAAEEKNATSAAATAEPIMEGGSR